MEKQSKKFLLSLARKAIEEYCLYGTRLALQEADIPFQANDNLLAKQGVFVTITKHHELRGCVGDLVGRQSIYQEVIDNAINAGFGDYRFSKLQPNELHDIKLEISVLSPLEIMKTISSEELVRLLATKKPGLYLEMNNTGATFLPQVWKDLKTPLDFLSQLCIKAGLKEDDWKNPKMNFWTYIVDSFEES
jgi:AmmeMemoRadiSam system protein A